MLPYPCISYQHRDMLTVNELSIEIKDIDEMNIETIKTVIIGIVIAIVVLVLIIFAIVTPALVYVVKPFSEGPTGVTGPSSLSILTGIGTPQTGPDGAASVTGPTGSSGVLVTGIVGFGQIYANATLLGGFPVSPNNPIPFDVEAGPVGPVTGSISYPASGTGLQINTGGTFEYKFTVLAASDASHNFIEIGVNGLPPNVPSMWSSIAGSDSEIYSIVGRSIFQLNSSQIPASIELINISSGTMTLGTTGIVGSLSVVQLSL